MTDATPRPESRPRPEYGEYATPEEVAEARGPLPADESAHLEQPTTDRTGTTNSGATYPAASPATKPTAAAASSASPPPGARASGRHPSRWDFPLTVALLAVGLVNTISSIPSYLNLSTALNDAGQAGGLGDLSFGAAADAGGIALLLADSVILLISIALAWRRVRAGKRAIWVPIVAFLARLVFYVVVVTIVVLNTPGFTALVQNPPS